MSPVGLKVHLLGSIRARVTVRVRIRILVLKVHSLGSIKGRVTVRMRVRILDLEAHALRSRRNQILQSPHFHNSETEITVNDGYFRIFSSIDLTSGIQKNSDQGRLEFA